MSVSRPGAYIANRPIADIDDNPQTALMGTKRHYWGRWVVGIAIGIAALVALNFETVNFVVAMLFSEKRPSILRDARWNDPVSAHRFNREFKMGTAEDELLAWLERNQFTIDRSAKHADRFVESLPCNERVVVIWASDGQGRLQRSTANVTEAGCL